MSQSANKPPVTKPGVPGLNRLPTFDDARAAEDARVNAEVAHDEKRPLPAEKPAVTKGK